MAEAKITINVEVSGLDLDLQAKSNHKDSATPETGLKIPEQTQETADIAEALNVGAVDTVKGIMLKAVDNDMLVDTNFDTTFSEKLRIREGNSAYFEPIGEVYIKNETAAEQVKFSGIVWGEQS